MLNKIITSIAICVIVVLIFLIIGGIRADISQTTVCEKAGGVPLDLKGKSLLCLRKDAVINLDHNH